MRESIFDFGGSVGTEIGSGEGTGGGVGSAASAIPVQHRTSDEAMNERRRMTTEKRAGTAAGSARATA